MFLRLVPIINVVSRKKHSRGNNLSIFIDSPANLIPISFTLLCIPRISSYRRDQICVSFIHMYYSHNKRFCCNLKRCCHGSSSRNVTKLDLYFLHATSCLAVAYAVICVHTRPNIPLTYLPQPASGSARVFADSFIFCVVSCLYARYPSPLS